MSITVKDLTRVLEGLSCLLPMAKQLNESAVLLMWATFPEQAKEELTPEALQYAAGQRMLDPDPAKETPLHLQLLRYLYALENGQPNLRWGLKVKLDRLPGAKQFNPSPKSQWELDQLNGRPDHDAPTGHGVFDILRSA